MRDLIFRIWHKEAEEMAYFIIGENNISVYSKKDGETYTVHDVRKFPVMQFTGKYDCKRIPVFEGDIIEFDRKEWGGDDNIHIVSWDDHNAEWSWGGGITSDMGYRTVIGNIHANPDLIK